MFQYEQSSSEGGPLRDSTFSISDFDGKKMLDFEDSLGPLRLSGQQSSETQTKVAQFDMGVNQTHTPVARHFLRNASFGLNPVQKGVFDYSEY